MGWKALRLLAVAVVAAVTCAAAGATGGSGTLDPTWGSDGVGTTVLGTGGANAIAVVALASSRGRTLVSGWYGDWMGDPPPFLLRFTASGRIDRSFATRGRARTGFLEAVLPDGKLMVTKGPTAIRLNANGTVDRTYGTRGVVRLVTGKCPHLAGSVAVEPSGAVDVVVGECANEYIAPPSDVWAVMRILPGGRIDRSFGVNGLAAVHIGVPAADSAYLTAATAVLRQRDGRLVIVGDVSVGGFTSRPGMIRLRRGGTLDPTFGDGGRIVAAPDSPPLGEVWNVFLMPDGQIVFAGCRGPGGGPSPVVIGRFGADGAPDTRWGPGGLRSFDLGGHGWCAGVAPAPGGKLLALGDRLWRLLPDGSPDPSFGQGGSAPIPSGPETHYATSARGGRIIIAGDVDAGDNHAVWTARFNG